MIRKRIETVEQALGQVATGELHLPVTKTLMESALKHNKEIAKDEDFLHLMVRCNFDKTDPEFMKKFAAMGGDTKQLAAVRTQRENDENEWKNLKDTIDQNKIPLPQGLPNLMPKLKPN